MDGPRTSCETSTSKMPATQGSVTVQLELQVAQSLLCAFNRQTNYRIPALSKYGTSTIVMSP